MQDGDAAEGGRVRLTAALDRSGAAVMMALPDRDTANMSDDPELREFTCDPKFRRVLVTDGRSETGQALVRVSFSKTVDLTVPPTLQVLQNGSPVAGSMLASAVLGAGLASGSSVSVMVVPLPMFPR